MNIRLKDWLLVAFIVLAGLAFIALAKASTLETSFSSGKQQIALIELYSSEGCSSCPPADRWVTSLKQYPDLWQNFIPVVLHVDYWDHIGWKDRFAKPAHGERQRQYAIESSLNTVYTPGVVYNGKEWRNWFNKHPDNFPQGPPAGVLELNIQGQEVFIRYTPTDSMQEKLDVNLALLGFNLATAVNSGENRGKKLNHDFVVLAMNKAAMLTADTEYTARMTLPRSDIGTNRYGVAAWVNQTGKLAPLQAVGGWLANLP